MKSFLLTTILACGLVLPIHAQSSPNLAPTPPMGWNSWNWHGKQNINETVVRETIDAMVSSGLRDAGYNYVVVDGGWRDTKLGPNGELLAHPVRFPHGMKALADYAHAKGLKFGLHTTPGTHDCGGDPVGGFGHEEVQVKQFVEWGLDFIKLDKCKFQPGWTEDQVKSVYTKWRHLLDRCGRDIVLSISAYVYRDWYPGVGQMARTTYDIRGRNTGGAGFDDGKPLSATHRFLSVMTIAEDNNRSAATAGPGFWNDPDMLVVGRHGLTEEEQQAHFALWCIMSAPLMLGNDPRDMTPSEKAILLNHEVIAIDQDPTEQGRRIHQADGTEVWLKHLRGGRVAVLLLNRDATTTKPITFQASDGQLVGKWTVRDVNAHADLGTFDTAITKTTPPRSGWFLLITPQNTPESATGSTADPAQSAPVHPDVDPAAPMPKTGNARFFELHESFLARGKAGPIGLLFLGDSITRGWDKAPRIWEQSFGKYQPANFGIGGDQTQHVIWRIEHGELDGIHPKVVVLMLGTNNSGHFTGEQIAAADRKIVELIRAKIPGVKVLLLAIFPRDDVRPDQSGQITAASHAGSRKRQTAIAQANALLAKLDDGANVRFLDIGAQFLGPDGRIPPAIMPDHVHLGPAGYQLWADAMQPLLTEMMEGTK